MDWQPIETAPKKPQTKGGQNGVMVLFASAYGHIAVGYWGRGINPDGHEAWVNPHDHMPMSYWNSFTHWMPLPPPPQQ